MMIAAFLQLRNERESGHLSRCLDHCQSFAEQIYIYDDGSTDDSFAMYADCDAVVIRGGVPDWHNGLWHKQALLERVLVDRPDWIAWLDADDTLDGRLVRNLRDVLGDYDDRGIDGVLLHNRNLWRSEVYYRTDSDFDGLWKVNFWRNNGHLRFSPVPLIHVEQHPGGMGNIIRSDYQLMHYGFASEAWIRRKHAIYKALGQCGADLDRLVDERGLTVARAPSEWYAPGLLPANHESADPPTPIEYGL